MNQPDLVLGNIMYRSGADGGIWCRHQPDTAEVWRTGKMEGEWTLYVSAYNAAAGWKTLREHGAKERES